MKDGFTDYHDIKIYELEKSFKETLTRTGKRKVAIGLSGGIDSALAAVLIGRAIGNEFLYPVFMPYKTSHPSSMEHARLLAERFSLKLKTMDITKIADAFFADKPEMCNLRRGNAMARLRMTTLFDVAQKEDAIVAGTSNKTEIMLGYGTWYGDTASSINIIGSLYKREVYELSARLQIPEQIITKKPSADLWEGQTDEEELGFSYEIADKFLYALLETGIKKIDLENIFGTEITGKVSKRIKYNSFKRKMPEVCGVSKGFFESLDERIKGII